MTFFRKFYLKSYLSNDSIAAVYTLEFDRQDSRKRESKQEIRNSGAFIYSIKPAVRLRLQTLTKQIILIRPLVQRIIIT